jgi:hypothetical protein
MLLRRRMPRPPGFMLGISPGQRYRTSRPVTARPMIMRWISDVPSKMVKILAMGAVYAGQRPVAPRGISTDSARPVRDDFRFRVGPVRDWRAGRRRAPVGGRGQPGSWRTPSAECCLQPDAAGTFQVYSRTDLHVYLFSGCPPLQAVARGQATRGPDAGNAKYPGPGAVAPTRRRDGATGLSRHCRHFWSRTIAAGCGLWDRDSCRPGDASAGCRCTPSGRLPGQRVKAPFSSHGRNPGSRIPGS